MKKIILLCLILIGAALLWIPRGPALPPGLTFAQITNPTSGASASFSTITAGSNSDAGAFSTAGTWTHSANGALSLPAMTFTGTPITGGSGTTTFPLFYLNSGAAAPTTFNTNGTVIGINAPSGWNGDYFAVYKNGVAGFKVAQDGTLSGVNNIVSMNSLTANGTISASTSITTPAYIVSSANGAVLTSNATACETGFATTTLATGATTTDTGQNCLPANSIIDAVVARVTTTITAACTGWSLGDATTSARFASNNTTLTSGTTTDAAHIGTYNNTGIASATTGIWQAAAAKVRITCAGGNPGAGAIRVIVFSHSPTAPTS